MRKIALFGFRNKDIEITKWHYGEGEYTTLPWDSLMTIDGYDDILVFVEK